MSALKKSGVIARELRSIRVSGAQVSALDEGLRRAAPAEPDEERHGLKSEDDAERGARGLILVGGEGAPRASE